MGFVNSKGEETTWTDPRGDGKKYLLKRYGNYLTVVRVGKYSVVRIRVPSMTKGIVTYRSEVYAKKAYSRTLPTKSSEGKATEAQRAAYRRERLVQLGQVVSTLQALKAGARRHPLHDKLLREIDIECLSWGS